MTVNELIDELRELKEKGLGENKVAVYNPYGQEFDEAISIKEDGIDRIYIEA